VILKLEMQSGPTIHADKALKTTFNIAYYLDAIYNTGANFSYCAVSEDYDFDLGYTTFFMLANLRSFF